LVPAATRKIPIMPLHLIKLCVGCDSVEDLQDWIREKLKDRKKRGLPREHVHTTRMVPKRAEELLDGFKRRMSEVGQGTNPLTRERAAREGRASGGDGVTK
jgi:hypothetical protein